MTPKEKAEELVDKYHNLRILFRVEAKQCALIAVDEILEVIYYEGRSEYIYWQEVKQEIEKL